MFFLFCIGAQIRDGHFYSHRNTVSPCAHLSYLSYILLQLRLPLLRSGIQYVLHYKHQVPIRGAQYKQQHKYISSVLLPHFRIFHLKVINFL